MIQTYPIEDFFKSIEQSFEVLPFEIPEAKYVNGNISYFELAIICLLCKNINPHNVLEFGTFNGRTTINIAYNINEKSKIITVDLPKGEMKNTKYDLEGINEKDENDELGYVGKEIKLYNRHPLRIKKKIKQLWMDSANFPVNDYIKYFDFIFVDASHSYGNVLNDSMTVFKCIKDKGFILWHDYNGWPGVTKALNKVYNEILDDYQHHFVNIKGTSMVLYYATFT